MRQHVTVIGALHIGFGLLGLLVALIVFRGEVSVVVGQKSALADRGGLTQRVRRIAAPSATD